MSHQMEKRRYLINENVVGFPSRSRALVGVCLTPSLVVDASRGLGRAESGEVVLRFVRLQTSS